jgi:FkbM family methyltransferase
LIRQLGYDVVRYIPDQFLPPFDILPCFFRAYIGDLLESTPDFFFIQVGAHDGCEMDPIRESILAYHLRGLLIEPLPDAFAKLRENYRSEPQLIFENVAIGDEPGQVPFYRVKKGEGAEWWQVLAGFDKEHMISEGVPKELIEEIRVQMTTLPPLLQTHGIRDATLLQVDTEGYDFRIVKVAVDAGLRPKIINYEHVNLSRIEQNQCKHMLYDLGYRFLDVEIDTLCCLTDESPVRARAKDEGKGLLAVPTSLGQHEGLSSGSESRRRSSMHGSTERRDFPSFSWIPGHPWS